MKKKTARIASSLLVLALGFIPLACGSSDDGAGNANNDRPPVTTPRVPSGTLDFGWVQVTSKCDHGHRVYVAQTNGDGIAMAAVNDDGC